MNEITANQHRFAYSESGEGRVALFVHGFPLDSTMWLEQFEALSDVRRCNAADLRGFGASDPSTRGVLSMEEHAARRRSLAPLRALGWAKSPDPDASSMKH